MVWIELHSSFRIYRINFLCNRKSITWTIIQSFVFKVKHMPSKKMSTHCHSTRKLQTRKKFHWMTMTHSAWKRKKQVGHAIFRSSFLSWIFETFRWFNNNFIDGSKHNNNCLCWCQLSGVMLYKWNSLLWRNVWISRAEKKRIDVIWCPWIRFFYLNSLRICVYVLLNFDNASLFNHF